MGTDHQSVQSVAGKVSCNNIVIIIIIIKTMTAHQQVSLTVQCRTRHKKQTASIQRSDRKRL